MPGKRLLTGADFNNQRLTNLADGSSPTDGVTKQQLDAVARGLDWKNSARAATTANVTLSGTQTVDGVALAVGDRVLVKDQSTGGQNGLYVVSAGAWSRSDDADSAAEVTSGMAVSVTEGTVNGDKTFVLTTNDPITLGTTALSFSPLGGSQTPYTNGNGLALSGQTFSVLPKPSGGIVVDGTGVSIDYTTTARIMSATVGNGSLTSFAVAHNFGKRWVKASIAVEATGEEVDADVTYTDANTVTVAFASAPTANQYRVTVVG